MVTEYFLKILTLGCRSPIVYSTPKQYYLNKQSFQISGFYSLM